MAKAKWKVCTTCRKFKRCIPWMGRLQCFDCRTSGYQWGERR